MALTRTVYKNLLGGALLRCPRGQPNHQKRRPVSSRARIRSRARCDGRARIRYCFDRDLAYWLLINAVMPLNTFRRVRTLLKAEDLKEVNSVCNEKAALGANTVQASR